VATKHPRIAVTRDPELDAALRRAGATLGDRPAATLVRDLALRGAASLPPSPPSDALRELIEEHGGRLAARSLTAQLDEGGTRAAVDHERAATRALEDLRAERRP
jgi:hypothetical protein